MSPVREALPPEILYRLGRLPNPLAWPPLKSTGAGRFDDALGRFSTLYAAEQRVACFIESLARFRLSPQALLQLRRMGGSEEPLIVPSVPGDWRAKRILSRFRLRAGQKWLDLRS